ncbi:MAG: ComF family protein [Candidatus Azobacteroides sp.]|nr:ComF family protein [Candidatus Azobacteroides sp.]
MKKFWQEFVSLFFPELCKVCQCKLLKQEQYICLSCLYYLPRTNYHFYKSNSTEERFFGKFPLEKATSFIKYVKGSPYHNLLTHIKYHGNKELGAFMGECFAIDLDKNSFFLDVDIILPVPLHQRKLKKRGYNQSEWIAMGIGKVLKKRVDASFLYRKSPGSTQTRKNAYERWLNVENIFAIKSAEKLKGKHILLVDDVLTTGATLASCANTLQSIEGIKISVATLSIA